MPELVVASPQVRDGMQRSNRKPAGRDVPRERFAHSGFGETEKLRALPCGRRHPKVVVGRPHRAREMPEQHAELFLCSPMVGALGLDAGSLDSELVGLTRVLAPTLTRKLVEQPQRSTGPKVGLATQVVLGQLDSLVDELPKTGSYAADRIGLIHAR